MTSKAKLKALIEAAYFDCERLCDAVNGPAQRAFREAFEHALAGERAHRRLGRNFTQGRCAYRGSADLAAMYFAARFFLEGAAEDPADVLEMRDDKRCAYIAARKCPAPDIVALGHKHAEFLALDYAQEFPK